jgi:hypothetical protein
MYLPNPEGLIMAHLVIRRDKVAWQDRGRSYRVIVDGKELAQIANGAEMQIPVKPGKRLVQLKFDWCQSEVLEVNVETGKTLILECGPNSTPLLALVYITLFRKKYLWLRPAV